ncbi:MAG: hypothetical protein ABIA11_04080 [Patescibacteria group bacterium]|nr:hypothetical protein [Patescibacteria group bacterium]
MIQKLSAPISVLSYFNHKKRKFSPLLVVWEGKEHKVSKIGYQHKFWSGNTLFHVFSVVCEGIFFKIKLNTQSLSWEIEEISDGETN